MRLFTALLFGVLLPAGVSAQMPESDRTITDPTAGTSRVNYGVTVGTEYCTVAGLGSAWSTSVTPRVAVPLTKKFTLSGGIRLTRTGYDLNLSGSTENATSRFKGTAHTALFFLSGQYRLTDRLSVSGSAFGTVPLGGTALPYDPFRPLSSREARGAEFRVGYRVARNAFIEAGFRYTNGLSPYDCDPFHSGAFPNTPVGSWPGSGAPRW